MKRILYLSEYPFGEGYVGKLLEKRGLLFTALSFLNINGEVERAVPYSFYIFEISYGTRRHLDIVRKIKYIMDISAQKCSPFLFVVEENSRSFENAARTVPVDFYFTTPVDEHAFYAVFEQAGWWKEVLPISGGECATPLLQGSERSLVHQKECVKTE